MTDTPVGGLKVRFEVFAGWCQLEISDAQSSVSTRATTLHDALSDLVVAVADLAEGRRLTSVRWGGEPGGSLLDFARVHPSSLAVVVHGMAKWDWISGSAADPPWTPERGEPRASFIGEEHDVLEAFIVAFTAVAQLEQNDVGELVEWGWPFPIEQLCRLILAAEKTNG